VAAGAGAVTGGTGGARAASVRGSTPGAGGAGGGYALIPLVGLIADSPAIGWMGRKACISTTGIAGGPAAGSAGDPLGAGPSAKAVGPTAMARARAGILPISFQIPFLIAAP
jgi:hypothetical protein